MKFVVYEGVTMFPLEIPHESILWREFKGDDVRSVVDALMLVIPKLATEIPYESYTLLYMLRHPPKRNHKLGRILSRMTDLGQLPLIKCGKRGTAIQYFLNPTA